MKYNLTYDDGEPSSIVVVAGGKVYPATADHPKFAMIVAECKDWESRSNRLSEQKQRVARIVDLFDRAEAIGNRFAQLSERVKVMAGRVYFDGTAVDNALSRLIVKFLDAEQDFMPLVNFMEKIETNPNPHSREHLFRWLQKHDYSLCPDGDFTAYKAVKTDGKSSHSGKAIVNNEWMEGNILWAPGTVVEMPRDEVAFDPSRGCSTGLHVGNWQFASTFLSGPKKMLSIKINPRDVVSVPTESNDEKMRVCRARVLDVVTHEDKSLLYLGNADKLTRKVMPNKESEKQARPKRAAAPKSAAPKGWPRNARSFYESSTRDEFDAMPYNDLRWLAKDWGVQPGERPTKPQLVTKLVEAAAKRRVDLGWE